MQDKDFKDFDLQVRSMIEDVEVRPSRRVWKAVSSRLDAEAAPASSPWAWAKWAGVSLAAAAAIALGVFFSGTKSSTDLTAVQGTALTAQLGPEESAQEPQAQMPQAETAEAPQAEEKPAVLRVRRAPAAAKAVKAAAPAEEEITLVEKEELAAQSGQEESAARSESETTSSKNTVTREKGMREDHKTSVDPFAALAFADSKEKARKGPSSIYAKGAVGANESDFAFSHRSAMMAPGVSTGITESSESTYGVPFTLGLGVRFYLLPKLSIGTGLDYSLLTRTFTGKYTKVSDAGTVEYTEAGDVEHRLQYIGVPVNLYYDVISTDKIGFYVYGGGEAEYSISNKYTLFASPDIHYSDPVKKLQYSVGLGLGVQFKLTKNLGLYLDPGMKYYFHCDQPKNIRTDKPVLVNFDAGLRFNFQGR